MDNIPKTSSFTISKYNNKKGQAKYQIVVDDEYLQKIINSDPDLLSHIKLKASEL